MLSDLVRGAWSRGGGGRHSSSAQEVNNTQRRASATATSLFPLCTSPTPCTFTHLFHSSTLCQLDLGYRIGHISEKDDASGRLTDPLTKFDEVTAENLKYDMHDAKLFKKQMVGGCVE